MTLADRDSNRDIDNGIDIDIDININIDSDINTDVDINFDIDINIDPNPQLHLNPLPPNPLTHNPTHCSTLQHQLSLLYSNSLWHSQFSSFPHSSGQRIFVNLSGLDDINDNE